MIEFQEVTQELKGLQLLKLGTLKEKFFLEEDDPLYPEFLQKCPKIAKSDFGVTVFVLVKLIDCVKPKIKGKYKYIRFIYEVIDVIEECATEEPKKYINELKTLKENPELYEKYDDKIQGRDCINCDKTLDFPIDYRGLIGLPITAFDKTIFLRRKIQKLIE